jgi:hypothetical protein
MIEQLCHDRITLQNLGRLFENLSSTEPYKQVIILRLPNTPDKKKSAEMFDLLCRQVYGLGTYQTSSLRTLDQNKNLEPYINFEFSPFSCTVLNHPKVGKVGEITYRKLTKLFFGKRITFSDSFFGSETFYNSTPTVCMVYSDAQAEKIKNIFPSTILHLDSFDKLDPEDITSLSSDDCDFLYGTLPSLFEEGEQTKTATADEQHIRCFMGKYTRNAKDSFVYAAELYEAYTRYMERESGSEPLSSIRFGKKIRFLYSYDYYKPHKSRNTPNQYAYRGMALRTDKIKELLEKPLYQKSDMTVSQIINQRLKERSKSAD